MQSSRHIPLSIIVPFYNESQTLDALCEKLHATCGSFSQFIFVNDGSTDDSAAIVEKYVREGDVLLWKNNGGKGSAVRMGIIHAQGEYTIIQDADLEYEPAEIRDLLTHANQRNLDALFGSRRMKKQSQYARYCYYAGGVALSKIFNFLYGARLTDQPTCYKMVRTEILKSLRLKENGFGLDGELCCQLAHRNVRIEEMPISYHPRTKREGKKIGWKDWFECVWIFLKLRVFP